MNLTLLVIILCLSFALYLWVGNKTSQSLKDGDDYFLGGRGIKTFPLLMTFLATQVGGGALIGTADIAYTQGAEVLYYPIGVALGLMVLGMGVGKRYRAMGISTTAEIFKTHYGSSAQRYLAAAISIVSLFLILAAQVIALRKLFVVMGFDSLTLFIVFWCALVIYTVMGGFQAVVYTDMIQASFILLILGIAFFANSGTIPHALEGARQASSTSQSIPWVEWMLMPFCFILIEQDMAQRCFSAKNTRSIGIATWGTALLLVLSSSVSIYFACHARFDALPLAQNTSLLITSVIHYTTPILATFFIAAIFMAVLSTCDSLLCSISSNIYGDFIPQSIKKSTKALPIAKITTGVVGVACLLISFLFTEVITPLLLAYEMAVSLLFVPLLAAVFNRIISAFHIWWVIGISFVGYCLGKIGISKGFISFEAPLMALGCSFITWMIFYALKGKREN